MRRKPAEPVSTRTLGIVWHVVVPGTQTVTLVSKSLTYPYAKAEFTVMGWTLGPVIMVYGLRRLELLGVEPLLGVESLLEEEPLPQPESTRRLSARTGAK